jgi:hypothetical protein
VNTKHKRTVKSKTRDKQKSQEPASLKQDRERDCTKQALLWAEAGKRDLSKKKTKKRGARWRILSRKVLKQEGIKPRKVKQPVIVGCPVCINPNLYNPTNNNRPPPHKKLQRAPTTRLAM